MKFTTFKILLLLLPVFIFTGCKNKDTGPAGGEKKVRESTPENVVSPSFNLAVGTYNKDQSLSITNNTTGATIYYTTNGNYPTARATEYTAAIPIKTHGTEITIKAIAIKEGMKNSPVIESTYTINYDAVAMPTMNIPAGTYNNYQSITLSSTTSEAMIKYTTDGSEPTPSMGTLYSAPLPILKFTTLRAIAYKTGMADSSVLSAIFDFQLPDLIFTPASTVINVGSSVNISVALSDTTIQYTIGDGTQNSPVCGSSDPSGDAGTSSADIVINTDQTIKAVACKAEWPDSNIGTSAHISYPKIYAVDSGSNNRIIRMDNLNGDNWISYGDNSGDTSFSNPRDIYIASSGIYIADYFNNRIIRMDDIKGTNLITYGDNTGDIPISSPSGIFVDSSNKIYATEVGFHRVLRMDDMQGTNRITLGGTGSGNGVGQFNSPSALHLDSSGKIYIADKNNERIVRMNDMSGDGWTTWGSSGTGPDQFNDPSGIFVDSSNRIYVIDYNNHRVVRMNDMSGDGWTTLGGPSGSSALGKFEYPKGIFVDSTDRVYIADYYNYRIVRTDSLSISNWSTFTGTNGWRKNQFRMLERIFVW